MLLNNRIVCINMIDLHVNRCVMAHIVLCPVIQPVYTFLVELHTYAVVINIPEIMAAEVRRYFRIVIVLAYVDDLSVCCIIGHAVRMECAVEFIAIINALYSTCTRIRTIRHNRKHPVSCRLPAANIGYSVCIDIRISMEPVYHRAVLTERLNYICLSLSNTNRRIKDKFHPFACTVSCELNGLAAKFITGGERGVIMQIYGHICRTIPVEPQPDFIDG